MKSHQPLTLTHRYTRTHEIQEHEIPNLKKCYSEQIIGSVGNYFFQELFS